MLATSAGTALVLVCKRFNLGVRKLREDVDIGLDLRWLKAKTEILLVGASLSHRTAAR